MAGLIAAIVFAVAAVLAIMGVKINLWMFLFIGLFFLTVHVLWPVVPWARNPQ